tara:strand:+ start:355 stop:987 length:633 start_codon:yes stop_codon:yes gene_type:complete
MATFKQFNSQDIIISPLEVNKGFNIFASDFNDGEIGIDRYIGKSGNYLVSKSLASTDSVYPIPEVLVFNQAKHLYYSNYISGSYGDTSDANTVSFNTDGTITPSSGSDPVYQPSYYNYEQTTLNPQKSFPLSGSIGTISIPSKLFGDYIQPGSLKIESPISGTLYDDGNGRILITGESGVTLFIGNGVYEHGIINIANTLTDEELASLRT